MTDSKDDDSSNAKKDDKSSSSKRMKRRFQSQLSNVSFSSIGMGDSANNGSSNTSSPVTSLTSSTSFPHVSLRSIFMNPPFSKRTKPKRTRIITKHPKSASDKESDYVAIPERHEQNLSLGRFAATTTTRTGATAALRRSFVTKKLDASTDAPLRSSDVEAGLPSLCGSSAGPGRHSSSPGRQSSPLGSASNIVPSTSGDPMRECSVCLQDVAAIHFPKLETCTHSSCLSCMQQYLSVEISESRVNMSCPHCHQLMHPKDIYSILDNKKLIEKYEDFTLRRVLSMDPDTRWCPAPDCGYAVIAYDCAPCPKLKCERPGCESFFCYHCKAEWHPNQTCDAARAQRTPNAPFSSFAYIHDFQNYDDVKSCPRCKVLIVKMDDGSCNHMTCSICNAEFCWLCMKEISDLHYLSPSGCTFWGKKPWSRKKKILWQLGTLVGAPMGIGLVAGLAVPAMIIGIPIWVGRKIHSRYSTKGKHKRNLVMVGGITASAVLSPLLAGLAVSVGVPILLAYVYGVVPVSLCRSSGSCGVTASSNGVQLAFDENQSKVVIAIPGRSSTSGLGGIRLPTDEDGATSCSRPSGLQNSDATSRESGWCGASLSLSAADGVGAGSIASDGSFLPRSHRVEVQADVLSSGSRCASDAEDASTRALAGSLLQYSRSGAGGADSVSGVMEASLRLDSVSAILKAAESASLCARSDVLPQAELPMTDGLSSAALASTDRPKIRRSASVVAEYDHSEARMQSEAQPRAKSFPKLNFI